MDERRDTAIRAHWTLLEATEGDHGGSAPASANVLAVPLKAGDVSQATLTLDAPKTPGRWLLTLDIVDDMVGSFAASGSAPRTLVVTVVDGRERANPRG
jgi:hypothetical protein